MAIQHLKAINEELVDAQLDYAAKKLLYKEREADLLLHTDFEEVLGKKRPTVDEKKAYITRELSDAKHKLNHAEILVEKLNVNGKSKNSILGLLVISSLLLLQGQG